jgi:hypothetical protein
MRLSMLVSLCLISTAVLAYPVAEKDGWVVELEVDFPGQKYTREGVYPSKEACEAAISAVQRKKFNGHCIEFKAKEGRFIGSHDPALAGK